MLQDPVGGRHQTLDDDRLRGNPEHPDWDDHEEEAPYTFHRMCAIDKMSQEVTVSGTLVRKGGVQMIYVDSVK